MNEGASVERRERAHRWSYCEFLKEAGLKIKVPQLTIATAIVFCHRYYVRRSQVKLRNDRYVIATACLFLAGKVEETPKLLREVVTAAHLTRFKNDYEKAITRVNVKEFMDEQREVVLCAERVLLHALGFQLNVEHPYKHLLVNIKKMGHSGLIEEKLNRDLAQVAWNFANDSLRTTLCLNYGAKEIADGVLYLASKFLGSRIVLPDMWWETMGISQRVCEEICDQILDLYEESDMF